MKEIIVEYIKYKNKSELLDALSIIENPNILIIPFSISTFLNLEQDNLNCSFLQDLQQMFCCKDMIIFLCLRIKLKQKLVPVVYVIYKGKIINIINNFSSKNYLNLIYNQISISVVCGLNIYLNEMSKKIMKINTQLVLGFDDDRVYVPNDVLKNRYQNRLLICGTNCCYFCVFHKKYNKKNKNVYKYNIQTPFKNDKL